MKAFLFTAKGGKLTSDSAFNRARLNDLLKNNEGMRLRLEPITPESRDQRNFFEGAVIPLIAFYQEQMHHTNGDDCRKIRDWLKIEFNAEFVNLEGKVHKVGKSTKGELNKGFLERVMDWMEDQGYQVEVLNPVKYKHWRDEVYPLGGPSNYIDYLVELKQLKKL